MAMILEGIVTSLGPDGTVNIAPMGPRVEPSMTGLLLRPFPTSHTYRNLAAHGEGVFHVTDDVLLLAKAAVGKVVPAPPLAPTSHVRGHLLADHVRAYEFRVTDIDTREPRVRIRAEIVHCHRGRDWFGFNRARHAVLEAAILATRVGILPDEEIDAGFLPLARIVQKTGGDREHEALAFLQRHVESVRSGGLP